MSPNIDVQAFCLRTAYRSYHDVTSTSAHSGSMCKSMGAWWKFCSSPRIAVSWKPAWRVEVGLWLRGVQKLNDHERRSHHQARTQQRVAQRAMPVAQSLSACAFSHAIELTEASRDSSCAAHQSKSGGVETQRALLKSVGTVVEMRKQRNGPVLRGQSHAHTRRTNGGRGLDARLDRHPMCRAGGGR